MTVIKRFDDLGRIHIPKKMRSALTGENETVGFEVEISLSGDTITIKQYKGNPDRGEWLVMKPMKGNQRFKCSLCGGVVYYPQSFDELITECPYKRCPHCGFDMIGGDEA